MNKRFLHFINLCLGILSLSLAGCHSTKNVAPQEHPRPMLKYGVPQQEVVALYGVRMPAEEKVPDDTTTTQPQE